VVVREDAPVVVGRRRDDGAVLGVDGKVVGRIGADGTIVGRRDARRASGPGSGSTQPEPEPEVGSEGGGATAGRLHPDALYANATVRPDGTVEAQRLHRGDAVVPPPARPAQRHGQKHGHGHGHGHEQVVAAELRLPHGLRVDETYHFEVQPTAETQGAAETLTVRVQP